MAKERHRTAFVVGAILGGAVGAVLGLMKAPSSGAETRFDIGERWHDVEELAAEELVNIETEVRDRLPSEWTPGAARA